MDQNNQVTKTATKKKSHNSVIRIYPTSQKKLTHLLNKINKKSFGKTVKAAQVIECALELISESHIKSLQDGSLSNADKLEMTYRAHIKANGPMSKDEYLGYLLSQSSVTKEGA